MKKILFTIALALLTGCASFKSQQINVTAAYPFEGRYDSNTEIVVDGKKLNYSESIWILSNKTLYGLLTSANPSKRTSLLLQNNLDESELPTFFEVPNAVRDMDDFCNEQYVWETWIVSTNRVEF